MMCNAKFVEQRGVECAGMEDAAPLSPVVYGQVTPAVAGMM